MKKILTVSLVAMMAVSGARADLASTAYVDTKATTAANAAQTAAIAAAKTETETQISTLETEHATVLGSGINSTKVALIATNAENIAKNAQAITDGDDAVKATIGTVAEGKTVVQMIEDAQSAATYDDTEVLGLISGNANAIDAIEKSAYATSGITSALVGKISTNESAITTLNAGAETAGSVDHKIAAATANMATDTELSDGLATKTDKTTFETLQTAVNDQVTGLAATYALADAAQTAAEVTTPIDNKITGLNLANTYAAKTATETGIQEAKDAASAANTAAGAAQSTADSALAKANTNETAISKLDETYATDTALTQGLATKQNTLTATDTIGIAENGAISVNNASIGTTQLAADVNASLALADTSFQVSAVKAATEGGDGEYALTMKTVNGQIQYVWNKISYTVAE